MLLIGRSQGSYVGAPHIRGSRAASLRSVSRRGFVLFIAVGLIWGLPYLLIKIAVESIEPAFVVFVRVALGAAILLPIALARRQLRPLKAVWRWVVVFALVEITFPFIALTWAERHITSSLAALLIAAVPIVGAILAWRFGLDTHWSVRRGVGLALGLLGVGALVGLDVQGTSWLGVAAVGVTVLGYALGPIVVEKRLRGVPSLPVIAASLGINAIIYAPLGWLTRPEHPVPANAWASMVVLGLVCTALAFVLFFALITEVGAPRAQVITYINPAVAVALGVLVLSEPVTLGILVGFPMILAGSYLATRGGNVQVEAEPHA